jgi:Na+-translocating ferredoxin:NAD+ oxidoreductase RNF subunit RnfB
MGHLVGKDIYTKLGKKIDGGTFKTPMNDEFYAILKELYSYDEAELIVKMPYKLSSLTKVQRVTKIERGKLQNLLNSACSKGLIVDVQIKGKFYYIISPLAVGIFEYTMMRTGEGTNPKKWAHLFNDYIQSPDSFYKANFGHGEQISVMRTLPHTEAVLPDEYVQILDYEKAYEIVEKADKFSLGICSCRHEKMHLDEKDCDVPLETCTSVGVAADFLIRHNMAREVSKEEMLENLAISEEKGLVLNADNVKNRVSFICQCCSCCCNLLQGISKHGYPNTVVTSSFIADLINDECTGCSLCEKACPINAVEMIPDNDPNTKRKSIAKVDKDICLGCGVCVLKCKPRSLQLVKRKKRVIHPESTYERVILQSLERGNLQNFLFDNPGNNTHAFMRGVVGAFLKLPPVKRSLMSDTLRSRFLKFLTKR